MTELPPTRPRIAVCLSGLMRCFELAGPSQIFNVIEPNNADLFISTWDVIGTGKHNYSNTPRFQERLDVNRVHEIYGKWITSMVVHPFNDVQETLPKAFYPGMVSMFWQIYQANAMKCEAEQKGGFKYDAVIRMRPDMWFNTGFQLTDVSLLSKGILARHVHDYTMDDTFAMGSSALMDIYSALVHYIVDYNQLDWDSMPFPEHGRRPERILFHHVFTHGVLPGSFGFDAVIERGGHSYD